MALSKFLHIAVVLSLGSQSAWTEQE